MPDLYFGKPMTRDDAIRTLRKLAAAIYRGEPLFDGDSLDLDRIAMWLTEEGER